MIFKELSMNAVPIALIDLSQDILVLFNTAIPQSQPIKVCDSSLSRDGRPLRALPISPSRGVSFTKGSRNH